MMHIDYDAYRHGSKYEIKKTYKATEFISENLGNEYYGDYLKNRYKKCKNLFILALTIDKC